MTSHERRRGATPGPVSCAAEPVSRSGVAARGGVTCGREPDDGDWLAAVPPKDENTGTVGSGSSDG